MKAQSKVKENGPSHLHRQGEGPARGLGLLGRGGQLRRQVRPHPDQYVRDFERLLTGGIWAQVDMRFEYDEESKGKHPFWIDRLSPIQIATFDLEEYRTGRGRVHRRTSGST